MSKLPIDTRFGLLLALPMLIGGALCSGCSSSEETGAQAVSREPQPTPTRVDTSRTVVRQDTIVGRTPPAPNKRASRVAPRLKSKQDTLNVSMVKRSRPAQRAVQPPVRPKNPSYTVQVGAYSKAPNALRAQKLAKQRYGDYPVFNKYDASARLYRVSIGRTSDRRSASQLRRRIATKFPDDYAACWVTYIQP